MHRLALSFLALFVTAAAPAFAAQPPPARVGRVSFVSGHLGFHMTGESRWSASAVNYPVATGASFWTDPKSRAEIRVGPQTIDLANNSEIDVKQLDRQVLKLAVAQGRIELHLRELKEGQSAEIDIPRGAVYLLQPGIYDIDAGSPDHPARIAVFAGSARFVGGTLDIAIKSGDTAVIAGTTTLTATIQHATPDMFAQWCRSREYHENRLASPYYVSPWMTGYEELDEYGAWRSVPEYGEVWYPRALPVGWVPYRDGYWIWVAPWGWTWVDALPWGFAPFHYGRWAFIGGAWGWVPGVFVPYPVYAPALVDFVADPAFILAAAVAEPLVGWFPLGPGEAYWPSYTSDPAYIAAVNTGAVADPAHLGPRPHGDPKSTRLNFANRRAATVVPRRAFAGARPVGHAALRVSDPKAQRARVTARAPRIRPAGARAGAAMAGRVGRGALAARHGAGGRAFAHAGRTHGARYAAHGGHFRASRHYAARRHFAGHFHGSRHFARPHFAHYGGGHHGHFGGGGHYAHFGGGGGGGHGGGHGGGGGGHGGHGGGGGGHGGHGGGGGGHGGGRR